MTAGMTLVATLVAMAETLNREVVEGEGNVRVEVERGKMSELVIAVHSHKKGRWWRETTNEKMDIGFEMF